MREIKFRAWDCQRKEMALVESWDFRVEQAVDVRNPKTKKGWLKYLDTGDIVVMQFTGLLDKNGKEIYEGDIVKVCNQGEYRKEEEIDSIARVSFDDGAFRIDFYNMGLNKKVCSGCDGNWNMEVSGNIYENPELLKGR